MIVGGSDTTGLPIPAGVQGSTMYFSTWLENVIGTTGDPTSFYELGTIKAGVGATFTSISISPSSPSAGQEVVVSAVGWTANPDRGMSEWTAIGRGMDNPTPYAANFTGPTFGITIPADAPVGASLGIYNVRYSNAIDQNTVVFPGHDGGITYLFIS